MSLIDRTFRLAKGLDGLGLCCADDGVFLAGTALLRKTETGWAARPAGEIDALIQAAYGHEVDPGRLMAGLGAVAKALNDDDLGRAMIVSVQLRLPDVCPDGAQRVARVDEILAKYNAQEPRDWHGRWTTGDGGSPAVPTKPSRGRHATRRKPLHSRTSTPPPVRPAPVRAPSANTDPHGLLALRRTLESKFDDLDALEFAKRARGFGDWLYSAGNRLNAEDRLRARVEYDFLQDRLSFWIGYHYTPPIAHSAMLSAALQIYGGANFAGIAHPGENGQAFPRSFSAAATAAMVFDGGGSFIGRGRGPRPDFEAYRSEPPELVGLGRFGGLKDNREVQVAWGRGIQEQGKPFEDAYAREYPDALRTDLGTKTFDFFWEKTGTAVSVKTLNTATFNYAKNPAQVYSRVRLQDSEAVVQ